MKPLRCPRVAKPYPNDLVRTTRQLLVEILAMLAAVVAVLSSGCMTRPAARDFDAGRAVAQPAAFEAPATTHLFAVAPISPPLNKKK